VRGSAQDLGQKKEQNKVENGLGTSRGTINTPRVLREGKDQKNVGWGGRVPTSWNRTEDRASIPRCSADKNLEKVLRTACKAWREIPERAKGRKGGKHKSKVISLRRPPGESGRGPSLGYILRGLTSAGNWARRGTHYADIFSVGAGVKDGGTASRVKGPRRGIWGQSDNTITRNGCKSTVRTRMKEGVGKEAFRVRVGRKPANKE